MKMNKYELQIRGAVIKAMLFSLFIAVMACSGEETITPDPSAPGAETTKLQLITPAVGEYGASTRFQGSHWEKGDSISVFVYYVTGSSDYKRNVKFVNVSDDPNLAVFEPAEVFGLDLSREATITAFYPREYNPPYPYFDRLFMDVTSPSLALNDLKVASALMAKGNTKVYLNFRRLTARVVVKLYKDILPVGKTLNNYTLKLTHTYSKCTINIHLLDIWAYPLVAFENEVQESHKEILTDARGDYAEFSFNVIEQPVDFGEHFGPRIKEFEFYDATTLYKKYQFPVDLTTLEAGKYYEYVIDSF